MPETYSRALSLAWPTLSPRCDAISCADSFSPWCCSSECPDELPGKSVVLRGWVPPCPLLAMINLLHGLKKNITAYQKRSANPMPINSTEIARENLQQLRPLLYLAAVP